MSTHRSILTLSLALAACGPAKPDAATTDTAGGSAAPAVALTDADYDAHLYVAPKPVRTYPAAPVVIQGWINRGDMKAIRKHGWDIWQSITAATKDGEPTWQTWYSGQEVFQDGASPTAAARPKRRGLPLERPRQTTHHLRMVRLAGGGSPPVDTAERVFGFNRFTKPTADYIWRNRLNDSRRLADTLVRLQYNKVPLASIQVLTSKDSVDVSSFVIKCVFQFIAKDTVTAIPYWDGYDSQHSTDSLHPPPRMWRQAVAVDPTGKHKPGDSVFMAFNKEQPQWLKVVPLSAFYSKVVTKEDSINLTQFGAENGDDLGFNSDTSLAAVQAAARPGNYGLLMAMHVTGKEIVNWTWQSFWWTPNPTGTPYGADRPATIPAPWSNYNMTIAYSMLTTTGQPLVAFNPYLETSLAGNVPVTRDSTTPWTGVITNCMSCHRRAAVAYTTYPRRGTTIVTQPPYGPAAQVNPGDSLVFIQPTANGGSSVVTLKTDFLWSVAVRAHPWKSPPPPASP